MTGRITRSRARRASLKLSTTSQERLLNAVAGKSAELLPTEADTGIIPSPSKPAGLPREEIQQSGVEHAQETVQQPELREPPYNPVLDPKAKEQGRVSPATLLQKRQAGSDGDDNEHRLKRVRLTRKNLAQFDKMTNRKGTKAALPSALPESSTELTTTKTISTTRTGFAIQADRNGILNFQFSKPPTNLEEIRERYIEPRKSVSPPESLYEEYLDEVMFNDSETTIMCTAGPHLLKKYKGGYKRTYNQPFTAFPKNVGFNNGLSAPQPDYVEGLTTREFGRLKNYENLDGAVLYKDNLRSTTLPHLAGGWKSMTGTISEAVVQSSYVGAALVYARNKALASLGKSDPPGHAEVTTFTTDGKTLNLYAHYAAPSKDGELEYHQYGYSSVDLMQSYQGHKDARKGLRNAQDHAFKQSHALIDQLKEQWQKGHNALQPSAEGALPPVLVVTLHTTNADEDEVSYEIVEQPCEPTPPTSSKPERLSGQDRTSNPLPSSRSLASENDSIPSSGGQKRKASLSSQGPPRRSSRQRGKRENH
ncbi:hypothetical protein F4825DRAFT_430352 [Nemania diffusa]|nr:hypothetical protein F4825DRAFT_430352 [Nemania diffusa]